MEPKDLAQSRQLMAQLKVEVFDLEEQARAVRLAIDDKRTTIGKIAAMLRAQQQQGAAAPEPPAPEQPEAPPVEPPLPAGTPVPGGSSRPQRPPPPPAPPAKKK